MTRLITTHPEGHMNVWTRFQGNPSNTFWDISLKIHKCQSAGGAGGKVKITKVTRIHPPGIVNVCAKFHGNPFRSCWHISVWGWTDQPTDWLSAIVIFSHAAGVAKNENEWIEEHYKTLIYWSKFWIRLFKTTPKHCLIIVLLTVSLSLCD